METAANPRARNNRLAAASSASRTAVSSPALGLPRVRATLRCGLGVDFRCVALMMRDINRLINIMQMQPRGERSRSNPLFRDRCGATRLTGRYADRNGSAQQIGHAHAPDLLERTRHADREPL